MLRAEAQGPRAEPASENGGPSANSDPLASVCGDLKIPLTSVLTGAHFLRQLLPKDDAVALRLVDAIRRAAERMDQLIVSVSDLKRFDISELTGDLGKLGPVLEAFFETPDAPQSIRVERH